MTKGSIVFVCFVFLFTALSACTSGNDSGLPNTGGDRDEDIADGDISEGDLIDGDFDEEALNPCDPNPCKDANKTGCIDDGDGRYICQCDAGFADYGDGACKSSDPCSTDTACAAVHRECENNQGAGECGECLGGYHLDGDGCVEDVACGDNTCNGHGDCADDSGIPVCDCAAGYLGERCDACDIGNGWHWNAAGEACTTDPCDPNPCSADDHRVCDPGTGQCLCDTGFCDVDAACISDGTENPDHDCSLCDSAANKNGWSLRGSGHECRASAGECDAAEMCDGITEDCPTDGFVADATSCNDDANACNGVNTCQSGSCEQTTAPVTCAALDECHVAGVCDTDTGVCSNPTGHEGEVCNDDANACNGVNTCQSGSCEQTTAPVTCAALDECHVAGVCDTATGVCSNPVKNDGAVCETTNQCVGGVCEDCYDITGCADFTEDTNPCTDVRCENNTCANLNDDTNPCDDANDCTDNDVCSGGLCAGSAYTCNDNGVCNGDDDFCTCEEGFTGDYCDECAEDYFGYPNCRVEPGFIPITGGSFWMGSPEGCPGPVDYPGDCTEELGRGPTETLHNVTLSYNLEMGRYEITEAQFEAQMNWNPVNEYDPDCNYGCGGDKPVKHASWYDILAYANELSLDAGFTPCYVFADVECKFGGVVGTNYMSCFDGDVTYGGISAATIAFAGGATKPQDCEGYRLPTEAEWEYAIRAGDQYTALYQSPGNDGVLTQPLETPVDPNVDEIAWYGGNKTTLGAKPVGTKAPNAWGFYDMSGNVWEWTWDRWQEEYENDVAIDPVGPESGSSRVMRGGMWNSSAGACSSASRHHDPPILRGFYLGARLVRTTGRNLCLNGQLDTDLGETDVDCGGEICAPCGDNAACVEMSDCESLNCVGGFCVAATCEDGIQNGDEQGVDCSGSCVPTCGFVPITAGAFWMGSPDGACPEGYPGDCTSELGRNPNEMLHHVELTYDFELSRHEISQGDFTVLMGWNPSYFGPNGSGSDCGANCPVETLSWYDVLAYANELSLDHSLAPCYVLSNVGCAYGGNVGSDYMNCFDGDATYGGINSATVTLAGGTTKPQECEGYRLPTEAEWEYAIRAGTTTAFYNGGITRVTDDPNMDLIGWYYYNSDTDSEKMTHPAGEKDANAWGLYDMSGNVWEWTWDFYQSAYQNDVATDPVGSASGLFRVIRGGNWLNYATYCRSAYRDYGLPGGRNEGVGARLVRSLP